MPAGRLEAGSQPKAWVEPSGCAMVPQTCPQRDSSAVPRDTPRSRLHQSRGLLSLIFTHPSLSGAVRTPPFPCASVTAASSALVILRAHHDALCPGRSRRCPPGLLLATHLLRLCPTRVCFGTRALPVRLSPPGFPWKTGGVRQAPPSGWHLSPRPSPAAAGRAGAHRQRRGAGPAPTRPPGARPAPGAHRGACTDGRSAAPRVGSGPCFRALCQHLSPGVHVCS